MSEEQKFEFEVKTTVTFDIFRKFFISMMCQNKITAILMKLSPYIFITGVFFCLLDMILFKDESIGILLLIVVLLMGLLMLFLYYGQPRAVYNASKKEFSLPIIYTFNQDGFFVDRGTFDKEHFITYSDIDIIFESDSFFYFGYRRETYIIEKSFLEASQAELLSRILQDKNAEKYKRIKD